VSFTLADMERDQAHRFLATNGLYLHDNHIWPIAGPPIPLASHAVKAVQLLWDAEWERIKLDIEPLFKQQEEAAAARKAEAERRRAEEERRNAAVEHMKAAVNRRFRARIEAQEIEAKIGDRPYRLDVELENRRIHRNRPRLGPDYPEAVGGMSEHHLYGPRGFKNPFKYEDTPAVWAMPSIFPKGRVRDQLHYRPSRPLADNQSLSIVTAGICGDPPKGRSALEARAGLHG
jgi:hypothetical protein